jgi:putative membrane-bound dehydrogenase-like protein
MSVVADTFMNAFIARLVARLVGGGFFLQVAASGFLLAAEADAGRDHAVLEALVRLPAADLEAYPQHREAVSRYLQRVEGTPEYLRLVSRLKLRAELPKVAKLLHVIPFNTESTQAALMLLEMEAFDLVRAAVDDPEDAKAAAAIAALGYANSGPATTLLLEVLQDARRSRGVRSAAATALGRVLRGQKALLRLVQQKKLGEEVEFAVADALLGSADESVRREALNYVKPTAAGASQALPPIRQLVDLRGNPTQGKLVFETSGTCSKCHKVEGQGKEVGPDLSEIGSKLSREDMYVAILNPSAGVSHNYETYSLLTTDGTVITGMLVNQTDQSVTIRTAEAIETTIATADIESLKKQSISLMPADLQKNMPMQSLVDLVDYLASLKKKQAETVVAGSPPEKPYPKTTTAASREPQEALAGLDVAQGVELQLFSSEPLMLSPTNIDVDWLGRVWVCEAVNYRHFRNTDNPERTEGDRIVVLEDTDLDGRADKLTTFHQGTDIDSPHGICVLGKEVIVSAGANVYVFTDEDGDLKADKRRVLFTGIEGAQHDHGIHAFTLGPDGKLYFNFGNEGKRIYDADGKPIVDLAGQVVESTIQPYQQGMAFRCNLDGSQFETLGWNFRNNWELCLDSLGNIWQSDNDDDGNRGTRINFLMEFGNYGYRDELTGAAWKAERTGIEAEIPERHWHLNDPGVVPNLLQTGAGSPTGITVYEGELLPAVFRNQLIHCDPGPNIVRAYPVEPNKAGFRASIVPLVEGVRDQWFRPVDVSVAPDGSLVIADWYDPGVGGHRMGDTSRGRLFRAVPQGYRPTKPPQLDLETPAGILAALQSPNTATRYLAQQAIDRQGLAMVPALTQMLQAGSSTRMQARAAWQWCRLAGQAAKVVPLLLQHPSAELRIVGIRAARQHGLNVVEIVQALVHDPSPQVRRELAIALRHQPDQEMPKLWAELAWQHDGEDRWYLEALGIGADKRQDECFEAWLGRVGQLWDTPAGRDIVWRSRSPKAAEYLAKIILGTEDPRAQERYFRALDFHEPSSVQQALAWLLAEK